jgi:two-component system chemotaxis sensor kinase CheA
MRVFSLDIRSKLAGLAFGLVSAVVIALTTFFSERHDAQTERSIGNKAVAYAEVLAHAAEPVVAFHDLDTMREIFEGATLDPDLQAVTLYAENGAVLGTVGERTVALEAVTKPEVRRTPRVTAVIAPVVSEQGPRGVLVLEISTARIVDETARGKRGAAIAGLLAGLLGLGVSWLIGGSFARRVRRIQRATQAFAEGNLDEPAIADESDDEIGQLGVAFNRMAQQVRDLVQRIETSGREEAKRLDRIVVARTMELQWKNEDMAFILDNAGQGFITVNRNGRLAAERSAIVATWFGEAPEAVRLWDYLTKDDPEAASWLELGWEALFDDVLPLELAVDQLPKQARRGPSTFGLRYQPVIKEGVVEAVVLVVTDITAEIALRKAEAIQRELAGVFARMVADPSSVEHFVSEGEALVQAIQTACAAGASRTELSSWIHTLKGNASFLGLESLAKACHEMETQMAETGELPTAKQHARIGELWRELYRVVEPLLFGRRDRVVVRNATLRRHIEAIHAGAPRRQLVSDVASWLLEPTATRLERAAAQAKSVAQRLEKLEPNVVIEDNGVCLDAQTWNPFWTAFLHVVRNAVDHGIEAADTRIAAGKPEAGTITLRTFQENGDTVIEIEDDGAGIDWATLKRRAGLSDDASETSLVDFLFHDGVSTKSEVTQTSGRGLGLGAVRATCRAMGGDVDVRTRAGVGTVFAFKIPHAESEPARSGVCEAAA